MSSRTDLPASVSPVSVSRIPIFSPTRRPEARTSWRIDTSWGWAVVTGKLGQQHRDLLDAVRLVAEREDWTSDGRLHLLVDPAKLRSFLSGSVPDAVNWQQIMRWFRDLMQSLVEYHVVDPSLDSVDGLGCLVSDVVVAKAPAPPTRAGAFSVGRRYMRVDFGLGWSQLLASDRQMRYPLRDVIALRRGFSQAVARYCLSHRMVNDTVAGLMNKLCAGGRIRERRDDLAADAEGLLELGVDVVGDSVRYVGGRALNPGGRALNPGGRALNPGETHLLSIDLNRDQERLKKRRSVSKPKTKTITPPRLLAQSERQMPAAPGGES